MTPGQQLALLQVQEIARFKPLILDIENVKEPNPTNLRLCITVSILIGRIPMVNEGLRFRERETFNFLVPQDFPFRKPEVEVPHARFADKPHVQWAYHLCLYQSSTEWNPSDGMFGLLDRLEYWIQQGAINQLDPEGEPLHHPAVYKDYENGKLIIPRADTPSFSGSYWTGIAQILESPEKIELTAWHDIGNIPEQGRCALALLFAAPLPWEYPTQGEALFSECARQGVPKERLFLLLKEASFFTPIGQPIYFILGAPMRGIAGGPRKQHLSVWTIDAETVDSIRLAIAERLDTSEIGAIRAKLEHLLVQILKGSKISWCPVMEARPEVTIRRDANATLSYFYGKSVSIWGCGALGAHIAFYLCRAGVRRLVLRDNKIVTPGILVRQPFAAADIGKSKVAALKTQLLSINPELEIKISTSNIVGNLGKADFDWRDEADLVIDATASSLVRMRLEMIWNADDRRNIPVAGLMVDQTATRLVVVVARGDFSGGTWDLLRKAKLEVLRDGMYLNFADSFFPKDNNKQRPFQPEPGCSEPTFVGSSADSAGLAGLGLNLITRVLANNSVPATVQLFSQATETPACPMPIAFTFEPDMVLKLNGYEIRVSNGAISDMKTTINQNRRIRDKNMETGGLLWGQWDDAMRVIWLSNASGPPLDSFHSSESFRCGRQGTIEEHEARIDLTRFSVGYIGMWHTHPASPPLPSSTDWDGMHDILSAGPLAPRKNLLVIIGKDFGEDSIGTFLFERISGKTTLVAKGLKTLPKGML